MESEEHELHDGEVEDTDNDDFDEPKDSMDDQNSKPSLLQYILIVFFRIIHRFNISNNAASAIIAFISFILGLFFL